MGSLEEQLKSTIRDVPDFPKAGIIFKDITPILQDPELCGRVTEKLFEQWRNLQVSAVLGIESRGFLFGMLLAQRLEVPFVPVRKAGKLPYETFQHSYELEYGEATVEIHQDAIEKGQKVLIHDDLLATGGTAKAAGELVKQCGGEVAGFSFLINLSFLKGEEKLIEAATKSLVTY